LIGLPPTQAVEIGMNAQRDFLSLLISIVTCRAGGRAAGGDPGYLRLVEPRRPERLGAVGPGPVRNRSRMRTGPQAGVGDRAQLVGDYTNPILRPWAAEVVKKFGEMSLAGKGYPTPRNQCWPEQVPFAFANYGMQVIQQPDKVTILYPFDHQFRQVRLKQPHPAHLTPSCMGIPSAITKATRSWSTPSGSRSARFP
jgi:hypothetical protein